MTSATADPYFAPDQDKRQLRAAATLSAGELQNGRPVAVDHIVLHDPEAKAPGLRTMLEANKNKWLLVTPVTNDRDTFYSTRLVWYGRSRLRASGPDKNHLVGFRQVPGTGVLLDDNGQPLPEREYTDREQKWIRTRNPPRYERVPIEPDSRWWHQVLPNLKREVNFLFLPMVFADGGFYIVLPEGRFVPYRVRFTSNNSRHRLVACLDSIADMSASVGRPLFRGAPILASVGVEPVADAQGVRHDRTPLWDFVLQATEPGKPALIPARQWQAVIGHALAEGRLTVPPELIARPDPYALPDGDLGGELADDDDSATETTVIDVAPQTIVREPTEEDIRIMAEGGRPNQEEVRSRWFAMVEGTHLESDDARHHFFLTLTDNKYTGLREFLPHASVKDAERLIEAARIETENEHPTTPDLESDSDGPTTETDEQQLPF